MSSFHASTCFEHYVLIVRRSKVYYTASGIIIRIGGLPVHGMIPETVWYNFGLPDDEHLCSKHVEA